MANRSDVPYTLKREDYLGYPSLYRLYMEANDPTEYTFATKHLGGWDHWEELQECQWFKPYIEQWRRELEIRFRAQALQNIQSASNDPKNASAFQANKFLVGTGWKTDKRKAGQPSKAEIKQEATRLAEISRTLEDDFERISGKAN